MYCKVHKKMAPCKSFKLNANFCRKKRQVANIVSKNVTDKSLSNFEIFLLEVLFYYIFEYHASLK